MNLFECIGGGSGELQETVLWTNSSPTSNFANQTVTLSDDINNYEYLKVYYRISTTNSKTIGILVSVDDFKTTASTMPLINPAGVGGNTGNPAQRYFYYASDTTMAIRDAAVGTTVYNNAAIPTAICGLKYAKPKPSGTETTLWENSSPTASYAPQDVTLSDSINNYSKLKFTFRVSTTVATESSVEISVSEFQSNNQSVSANNYSCFASPNVTDGSAGYIRRFWYVGPTTAHYYNCQKVNSQGSKDTFNIPVSIKGIS